MGNNTAKKELAHAIQSSNVDKVYYILKKFPNLTNQRLDTNTQHTPLMRALQKQDYAISRILLADFSCDPNKVSQNISPLVIVAIKNNIELLHLLIEFKVQVHQRLPNKLTAMDYAITFGSYEIAFYLYRKFSVKISHDITKFKKLAESFSIRPINYDILLSLLCEEVHPSKLNKDSFQKSANDVKRVLKRNNSTNLKSNEAKFFSVRNIIQTQACEQIITGKYEVDEPTLQLKSSSTKTDEKSQ